MIKNDYIMTSSERIQDTLNGTTNSNEKQHKAIQLSKQLDEVVVGKHKVNKLSNPIRPLAQRYVDSITENSSLSPAKKAVLRSYLDTYVSKILWYMKVDKKEQATNTDAAAGEKKSLKRKRPDLPPPKKHKTILTQLLSPKKLRSKKEIRKKTTKSIPIKNLNSPPLLLRQNKKTVIKRRSQNKKVCSEKRRRTSKEAMKED